MTTTWILSANSSRATLFSTDSPTAPLTQLAEFDNPDARAKSSELGADRPGRTYDRHGAGRHAMEFELDPQKREQLRFAKALADTLDKGRVENAYERLVLVASPTFLGMLRDELRRAAAIDGLARGRQRLLRAAAGGVARPTARAPVAGHRRRRFASGTTRTRARDRHAHPSGPPSAS